VIAKILICAGLVFMAQPWAGRLQAQVPPMLNYQGRVVAGGTNFNGLGQFKFALVDGAGAMTLWSNDGTSAAGSQPAAAVPVAVGQGLYSVALGDSSVTNMTALPESVFLHNDVRLRVWFNDGVHGFELLSPDQRISAVGYAMLAATVPDGSITANKLAAPLSAQVADLSSRVAALSAQLSADHVLSAQPGGSMPSGMVAASTDSADPTLLGLGYQLFATLPAAAWVSSSAATAPPPALGQSGIWAANQLLVWGGRLGSEGDLNSGAAYRPDLDRWQPISTINAPAPREGQSAVWSGSELIVWGGTASGAYVSTGGRYDPSTGTWMATSVTGAPSPRTGQAAVWTGTQMLVWGGHNNSGVLADGALYAPPTDQWTPMTPASPLSARTGTVVVWTGHSAILWGGQDENGPLNSGAVLTFDGQGRPRSWTMIASAGAPGPRTGETAVWTGTQMLVWGGRGNGALFDDGAAFDPAANAWSPISTTNAPAARSGQAGVWTGAEMLIFGGQTALGTVADAAAYNPATNTWRPISGSGNSQARSQAAAVWSGTEFMAFGGLSNGTPVPSLQRLNPQPTWYLYRSP
jgi:N-acetylneuraminic acid mutarotase